MNKTPLISKRYKGWYILGVAVEDISMWIKGFGEFDRKTKRDIFDAVFVVGVLGYYFVRLIRFLIEEDF